TKNCRLMPCLKQIHSLRTCSQHFSLLSPSPASGLPDFVFKYTRAAVVATHLPWGRVGRASFQIQEFLFTAALLP
ncbi:unnamed protein product, partial [Closterium sp. Yama58-4]